MKVYIAGPMTGIKNYNREAFFEVGERVAELGHTPVHTANMEDGLYYETYIHEGLARLSTCDAMLLLPGYEKSNGVCLHELPYARQNGIHIYETLQDFIDAECIRKTLFDGVKRWSQS
uniref:DUF4406 domain-containing protein n=1 Tax=Ndongobacter massiliensis TaxID=1871025 RepID=UPI000930CC41|nr:DUF4406 domain-containing protein [Ndongobacter massiliensis]